MTRFFIHLRLTAMLALAAVCGQPLAAATWDEACESREQCEGEYGTTVTFADSPTDAAKQALKDEKLVFVLHVSGNFETPEYT